MAIAASWGFLPRFCNPTTRLGAKKKANGLAKKRSYEYGSWNLFVLITQLLGIHKLIPDEKVTRYTQAKIAKGLKYNQGMGHSNLLKVVLPPTYRKHEKTDEANDDDEADEANEAESNHEEDDEAREASEASETSETSEVSEDDEVSKDDSAPAPPPRARGGAAPSSNSPAAKRRRK